MLFDAMLTYSTSGMVCECFRLTTTTLCSYSVHVCNIEYTYSRECTRCIIYWVGMWRRRLWQNHYLNTYLRKCTKLLLLLLIVVLVHYYLLLIWFEYLRVCTWCSEVAEDYFCKNMHIVYRWCHSGQRASYNVCMIYITHVVHIKTIISIFLWFRRINSRPK